MSTHRTFPTHVRSNRGATRPPRLRSAGGDEMVSALHRFASRAFHLSHAPLGIQSLSL